VDTPHGSQLRGSGCAESLREPNLQIAEPARHKKINGAEIDSAPLSEGIAALLGAHGSLTIALNL
jgi:hypothetical protein